MRAIPLAAAIAAIALSLAAPAPLSAQLRIAILGDSLASGEGNPDDTPAECLPGRPPRDPRDVADRLADRLRDCVRSRRTPRWQGIGGRGSTADRACHRSMASGLLRAAEQLRTALGGPGAAIIETYACSGATTVDLGAGNANARSTPVMNVEEGIVGFSVPAQLRALRDDPQFADSSTGDRIDAIVMAVGANDIGFGGIVQRCMFFISECYRVAPDDTAAARVPTTLRSSYSSLAAAMRSELGTRVGTVFIVEYHNPSVAPDGPCGATVSVEQGQLLARAPEVDLPFFWGVSFYESRWVDRVLLPALNGAVRATEQAHGWRVIGGVAERFRGHGHCTPPPDGRWAHSLADSLAVQGTASGVVHPNIAGHDALRDIVFATLAGYREPFQAPRDVRLDSAAIPAATELRWTGGEGARRQVALVELGAGADVPAPGPLPGFAGDSPRQRILSSGGEDRIVGTTGERWRVIDLGSADRFRPDPSRHVAMAVRRCAAFRCSAWSAPLLTAAPIPDSPGFVAGSGPGPQFRPGWTGHRRAGVYQVAVPTGARRWDVHNVPGSRIGPLDLVGIAPVVVDEAGPRIASPAAGGRDRREPPARSLGTAAQQLEYHIRACNQTGCSAWASVADFVNPLATPAPGGFEAVATPLPCRMQNGRPVCSSADQGRRRSAWPEVPGANIYQVAAHRIGVGAGVEPLTATEPAVLIDRNRHSGLSVRACNRAGCSDWSEPRMLDSAAAPPPRPTLDPPPNEPRAQPTSTPPRTLRRP